MGITPLVVLLMALGPITTAEESVQVNSIFDFIMDNIRSNLAMRNFTVIPIPNLVKQYDLSPYFPQVSAALVATNGTLTDLTSLYRVGDVSMATRGKVSVFEADVALRVMKVVFRHYTLRAAFLKKSGDKLSVNVKKNAFKARLEARLEGQECQIKLRHITLTKFADVDVQINGFSFLDDIASQVAEWFIELFNGFVRDIAESYAKQMVNHAVNNRELCQTIFKKGLGGVVSTAPNVNLPMDNGISQPNQYQDGPIIVVQSARNEHPLDTFIDHGQWANKIPTFSEMIKKRLPQHNN